jgi:CRP-like cAMP-binding protein
MASMGPGRHPVLTRFAALTPLDVVATRALEAAVAQATPVPARADLTTDGKQILAPKLIVRGWAARVRIMADGRRQFQSFLLPGDLIGMCAQPQPLAVSTVAALTDVLVTTPPAPETSPALAAAYAISHALEEAYLLAHITRLGRMHAQERIADLLLELHERLSLAGLASHGSFETPLTQEMLGDALGLTSVHINRMLQAARRDGDLKWRERLITLPNVAALARKVSRTPVRVTAAERAPVAAAAVP